MPSNQKTRWADRWRTWVARLTGRCPDCWKSARCGWPHLSFFLDAFGPDDQGFRDETMVGCGRCVAVYGTALGSITHCCVDVQETIDGAIREAGGVEALVESALRPKTEPETEAMRDG